MPIHLTDPMVIPAAGEPPKQISEYVGRASHVRDDVSIARMRSPAGWSEPGQVATFDEFTLVLAGALHVEHEGGVLVVAEGEAVHVVPGEWVRYSTPGDTDYVAVCVPAFAPDRVERDRS